MHDRIGNNPLMEESQQEIEINAFINDEIERLAKQKKEHYREWDRLWREIKIKELDIILALKEEIMRQADPLEWIWEELPLKKNEIAAVLCCWQDKPVRKVWEDAIYKKYYVPEKIKLIDDSEADLV